MKVCIAEKPSVAKEIADIVGAKSRKDGYWEGNGYQVTWTFGHLCELKEPHEYDSAYREWNLNMLPILPDRFGIKLKNDKGIEKQFRVIQQLFDKAEEIINCGDAGQEGELIQRWVYTKTNCRKPVKRLWISSLTEEAIREGFKKLKDAGDYESLYYAGYSRAAADWLLGMNATRLYTLKFGNGNRQVLSIGRVQTPTLAMIVHRQIEINNFKSAVFFELKTRYRDVVFNAQLDRYSPDTKAEGDTLLNQLLQQQLVISSVDVKKGKESAPRLFDLTALQVECNKKFGLSADETLKTVQNLYERKLVTYPRVDTTYLPSDLYPKIAGIFQKMTNYRQLIQPLLAVPIRNSSKVFDDKKVTDHHAIITTEVTAQGLGGNEAKVYDTIARRFIAAFYPDCEVSNTTVLANVMEIGFKANGKQILEDGWRVVYAKEMVDEEEELQLLPVFEEGETGSHEPFMTEGKTSPPKYFTEASLLRAMETAGKSVDDEELRDAMKANGIGRPSTRAAIIETLFRRKYIQRERKNIVATPTGMDLILTIQNELLKSAELTGKWEYKLRQIERNEYKAEAFLLEMKNMVNELVQQVKAEQNKRISVQAISEVKSAKSLPECPKCRKGELIRGKSAYGCSEYKQGCDFKIPFVLMGKKLSENQVRQLVEKKKTSIVKKIEIGAEKKDGCFVLLPDFNVGFEEQSGKETAEAPPKKLVCPVCKEGTVIKGNTAYGCSNWKNGCKFRLPMDFRGHVLTEKMIRQLLLKGAVPIGKGWKVDGKTLSGKLVFENQQLEFLPTN